MGHRRLHGRDVHEVSAKASAHPRPGCWSRNTLSCRMSEGSPTAELPPPHLRVMGERSTPPTSSSKNDGDLSESSEERWTRDGVYDPRRRLRAGARPAIPFWGGAR